MISSLSFWFLTFPANAFVPIVYEPDSKELEKTGESIGKTAVQILQLGQLKEAAKLAELGLILKPKDYRLWSILGEAQRRNGSLKEASVSLKKATSLKPKKADLWFAEAGIALEQRNPKKAIKLLNKGLKLDPKNAVGYFQLGNCKLMQKNYKSSILAFKKAITIKPLFWEAINNKAIIQFETGNRTKAIETWRKVLEIEKNPEPMLALGAALNLIQHGNPESLRLAKAALKKNPKYVSRSYQAEQLWGDQLIEATRQLLSVQQLAKDVARALANIDLEN